MLTDNPMLLVAATILVVFVLGLLIIARIRRRPDDEPDASSPTAREVSPNDERKALGIVGDIRPKEAARPPASPPSPSPESTLAQPPAVPPPAPSVGSVKQGARVRRPLRADEDLSPEDAARAAVEHLLQGFQLATGANTVGLFRQDGAPGAYRYTIETLFSHNAFARPSGTFPTRTPLVPPGEKEPVLHRVGERGLPTEALRYYREEMTALRAVLAAPLRIGHTNYILVADAMQDGRLEGEKARAMIRLTARLVESIKPVSEPSDPTVPVADAPKRPTRREIIADELGGIGPDGLALALVTVEADGADELDAAGMIAAEAALEARLREVTPDGRIEAFGTMLYGVFLRDAGPAVDTWTEAADAHLRAAYPGAAVAIGVACHSGPASISADDFRAHATNALKEAYEQGEPVIVG